jgi:hypothetical protein
MDDGVAVGATEVLIEASRQGCKSPDLMGKPSFPQSQGRGVSAITLCCPASWRHAPVSCSSGRVIAATEEVRGASWFDSLRGDADGLTLMKRLKSDAGLRRLPVAVLTGFVFGGVREASLSAGYDLFVLKPCGPEVLCGEIIDLLVGTGRREAST